MNLLRNATRARIGALVSMLATWSVYADGMAMKYRGVDLSGYGLIDEEEQAAIIAHENGVQHMILAVKFNAAPDDEGSKESPADRQPNSVCWIFPVRATTVDDVSIEFRDRFPMLRGRDYLRRAQARIEEFSLAPAAMLIVPGCLLPSLNITRTVPRAADVGVDVGMVSEMWGMRAEVVDASDRVQLASYIESNGPAVTADTLASLDDYFNDEHVFIVSWITSLAEHVSYFGDPQSSPPPRVAYDLQPCMHVRFPTDRPFFPLKPSSIYGDLEMPLRLYVLGFSQPMCDSKVLNHELRAHHYEAETDQEKAYWPTAMWQAISDGEASSGTTAKVSVRYTRITAETPAYAFTDDLEFATVDVPLWNLARAIDSTDDWPGFVQFAIVYGFILLFSYLSAGVSGLIVHRSWRQHAWIGLFNGLTILGFLIALSVIAQNRSTKKSGDSRTESDSQSEVRSFQLTEEAESFRLTSTRSAGGLKFALVFIALHLLVPFALNALFQAPFS